jgi:quercetin 2,3-dioxygenase
MEIVSYVVDGELTHADSMGNKHTLTRGEIQYMSAGTGVLHSEHNRGDRVVRFLQIWIFPDAKDHQPAYGDHRFPWADRKNQWLLMVSGPDGDAPVKIHQDATIRALELEAGREIDLAVGPGR